MAERFLVDKGPEFTPNVTFQQSITVEENLAIKGIPNISQSISEIKVTSRPGGETSQVQFNEGGDFFGDPNFTFDFNTKELRVIGNITGSLEISAETGSFKLINGGTF